MKLVRNTIYVIFFVAMTFMACAAGWFYGGGELYAPSCPEEQKLTWCGGPF